MSNPSWIERLLAGDPAARAAELRAEIEDEVADHLATLAGRYAAEGEPAEAASAKAQADFGDASRVVGQCLWVHLGDQVMLRSLSLLLGVALGSIVCLLAYASVRTQRDMAEGFKELSGQLARLNERDSAAAVSPPRRPTVHGHLYLGDPSRPAANTYVEIYRMPEGDVQRVVFTEADGKFSVSNLPEGEYSVLTPLLGPGNPIPSASKEGDMDRPLNQGQSKPFSLLFGNSDTTIELDVQFQPSELQIELSDPLAESLGDPALHIVNALEVFVVPHGATMLPWRPALTPPKLWPARGLVRIQGFLRDYGYSQSSFLNLSRVGPGKRVVFPGSIRNSDDKLAPGTYLFAAHLGVGVRPTDPESVVEVQPSVQRLLELEHRFFAMPDVHPQIPMRFITSQFPDNSPRFAVGNAPRPSLTLSPGMRTVVRLKVPTDRSEQLEQVLFSAATTRTKLIARCQAVPLEFEVIGQEPLGNE